MTPSNRSTASYVKPSDRVLAEIDAFWETNDPTGSRRFKLGVLGSFNLLILGLGSPKVVVTALYKEIMDERL